MCNGTGSVRVRTDTRTVYRSRPSTKKEESVSRSNSSSLYDLNGISYEVHSKLNKNEFQVFSRGIVKHLLNYDFRRAAASFNYLMQLTLGSKQQPEEQLHASLAEIKKRWLDELVNYQGKGIVHIDSTAYDDKVRGLEQQLSKLYTEHFADSTIEKQGGNVCPS